MRVHLLPRGVHIAPMPALRDGDVNRRLQGGLPPEPNRSASTRLVNFTGRFARDPMKHVMTEYRGFRSYD